MARRYIRDSKGRFARTSGSGSSRIKSQFAANTRLAGAYQQAIKKNDGDWELTRGQKAQLPVRGVAPTRSRMRTASRMSNLYRGDVKGLQQDLNMMTAQAMDVKQTRRQLRRAMKWSSLL